MILELKALNMNRSGQTGTQNAKKEQWTEQHDCKRQCIGPCWRWNVYFIENDTMTMGHGIRTDKWSYCPLKSDTFITCSTVKPIKYAEWNKWMNKWIGFMHFTKLSIPFFNINVPLSGGEKHYFKTVKNAIVRVLNNNQWSKIRHLSMWRRFIWSTSSNTKKNDTCMAMAISHALSFWIISWNFISVFDLSAISE